jgi:hypothetical protein
VIAGYERRWQVEAQLAAFEHERKSAQNARHRELIDEQEAIFKAELERMDREGDYEEPERVVRQGAFAWIGEHGHQHVK